MEKIMGLFALIVCGLALTTIKHIAGFEMAVICGLSIIYSLHFENK